MPSFPSFHTTPPRHQTQKHQSSIHPNAPASNTTMPPAPPNSTVWVLTYETNNDHAITPSKGILGAYATEQRAQEAAHLCLEAVTRIALDLGPDAPVRPHLQPGFVGRRYNVTREQGSSAVVEAVLEVGGFWMRVRYEDLIVLA